MVRQSGLENERALRVIPPWLAIARRYEGLKEVPGAGTNPTIWRWLGMIRAQWLGGDDAAWCGTALAAWMIEAGIAPPREPFRALNWQHWGAPLNGPVVGAVAIMRRLGGGHVTLVVGKDERGNILGFGGNQSDGVRVSAFNPDRITDYRWPERYPTMLANVRKYGLPVGSASIGGSEA